MTSADLSRPQNAITALPESWRSGIVAATVDQETVTGWLELDLNRQLRFEPGIVVLTDRQLLAKALSDSQWQSWDIQAKMVLEHRDRAGVGTLDLLQENGLLARFVIPRLPGAVTTVRHARKPSMHRLRHGHCSVCGALPNPTRGACWRVFC